MEGLRRITFLFEADMEIRYLPDVPEPDDFVTHHGELWRVAKVTRDDGSAVVCALPTDSDRGLPAA
jgi:hypothetical protein